MAKFICNDCSHEQEGRNTSIKILDGEARHDIKCDECGGYMNLKEPKSGMPSFKANRWGQVM